MEVNGKQSFNKFIYLFSVYVLCSAPPPFFLAATTLETFHEIVLLIPKLNSSLLALYIVITSTATTVMP